ncbi:acyltransferase [Arthrobacter sp. ISL-5]|uniref:acyltransferase family protein n=1 Tax=Arthrobacter sp. ISL-5 TaxID=2819111 RepID=UPI001BE8E790|nr:acyltransferase [Arthrobacter sp. ISL-5]MBT2552814.1 acyltransferase [Arthrobacter sp. ISL-5]
MTALSTVPVHSRRIQGLDTIRGFAILLVLLRHAWPETFGLAGIVGVVVFFALSGYLITGLLERDIRDFDKVRYQRFYVHRLLRLMPALTFMLVGFAVIEGLWNLLGDRHLIGQSIIVGLTYTMNVPGIDHGSGALSHLWTLATEEQFYLLWPIALALGIRRAKADLMTCISILAALGICAASIVVVSPETYKIYSLPTSWVAAMLIGALARLREVQVGAFLTGKTSRTFAIVAVAILSVLSFAPEAKDWPGTYLALGPLIALCSVAIIFECKSWVRLPSAFLKPLHWLGTVSYAAYLWNYPIANWFGERPLSFFQGSASIVATLLAATISWYVIERPASLLRRRFDSRKAFKKPAESHRVITN